MDSYNALRFCGKTMMFLALVVYSAIIVQSLISTQHSHALKDPVAFGLFAAPRSAALTRQAGALMSCKDVNGDHDISPGLTVSELCSRRDVLSSISVLFASTVVAIRPTFAAPPFAVISEQLGYFPVTSSSGDTVYVPARARRTSSYQSIELAQHLQRSGAVMYGAYWCPHCRNQKEMFGREAWAFIDYIECAPQGFGSNSAMCLKQGVDGYPEWQFGNGKRGHGEMTLDKIAELSGFTGNFDLHLEEPLPMTSGSCR